MHENGLLVSNIPYYSESKIALGLKLELLENLPLNCAKETTPQYLSRLNNIYSNEFATKLNPNEKILFIYLSIISVARRILIPNQFYSEAEISKWIRLFSGKRIILTSILSASMPNKNVCRIKNFKTRVKIKRLSNQELSGCIEKVLLNKDGFLPIIHEFATFVNGDFAHILGIPATELNNISQSIKSAIPINAKQ